MNKKSYFWGLLTGVILTLAGLFIYGIVSQDNGKSDHIQYLEQPESYENKKETSFKVFQVFDDAALANEVSNKQYGWYNGNTVVIIGENFYSDQIVTIKNPQRVGTYSYTTAAGMPMTVPVIDSKK